MAFETSSWTVMSPMTNFAPFSNKFEIKFSEEFDKLSKIVTLWPLFSNESTRFRPMNPAPPVTKTFNLCR